VREGAEDSLAEEEEEDEEMPIPPDYVDVDEYETGTTKSMAMTRVRKSK
jgi:hypothetical protein